MSIPLSSDRCMRGKEPVIRDDGAIEIPLTQGKIALVDVDSYHLVRDRTWYAWRGDEKYAYYARSNTSRKHGGKAILMHREIAGACQHVDHDDGDGLNNRRSNLKPGSCSQNLMNQSKWRGRKTLSRFKGVSSGNRHHKWRAYIKLDGRQIWLGYFDIEEEAAEAYNSAAIQLFGDRARLNEVRGDLRPFAMEDSC